MRCTTSCRGIFVSPTLPVVCSRLTFPDGFDARKFLIDHAIPKFEVGYVPGDPFYAKHPEINHARISFSSVSLGNIELGIARLEEALRNYTA